MQLVITAQNALILIQREVQCTNARDHGPHSAKYIVQMPVITAHIALSTMYNARDHGPHSAKYNVQMPVITAHIALSTMYKCP